MPQRSHPRLIPYLPWLAALALPWLLACGAKTGLLVPDAGPDATSVLSPVEPTPKLCIELLPDGQGARLPLQTQARLTRADVALLVDVSGSMGGEIDAIRRELRDVIVPGIEAQIPDTRLSVASFSDFPVLPYGLPTDSPFRQKVAMTTDVVDVQGGVDALLSEDGQDHYEAHGEALYQLATGEGIADFVPPSLGCPSGGFGYPCFREDGLPVVLLFTDAPMHEGVGGNAPYAGLPGPPHTYEEVRRALVDRDIHVIGIFSGTDPADRLDLASLSRDTGAVRSDGSPLVFDIGSDGSGLGTEVIGAIETFSTNLIFDISLRLRDDDPSDGVDATQFVRRVVPVSARPSDGFEGIDVASGVFEGVRAGTRVTYEVELDGSAVVPGPVSQRFSLTGVFQADGRDVLGEVQFDIVVPGADGAGCDGQTPDGLR